MMRAYLREARRESSSDLAPVTTIFPDAKMSAVVFGSRIRMITAAKRCIGTRRYELITGVENQSSMQPVTDLWIVLCITGVHCNRLQIETCPEIDGSYDILEGWDDPFYICDILLF